MNWYKLAITIDDMYFEKEIMPIVKPDTPPSYVIHAFEKQSGKEVGYVEYIKEEETNSIHIWYIKVQYGFTSIGIGRRLIEEIMKNEKVTYQQINWGLITNDGQGLKHKLDKQYGAAPFREYKASN